MGSARVELFDRPGKHAGFMPGMHLVPSFAVKLVLHVCVCSLVESVMFERLGMDRGSVLQS